MRLEDVDELQPSVSKWLKKLILHIAKIQKEGRKVMLIALSRKMPRLWTWINQNVATLTDEEVRLLASCVYMTEHAIPLELDGSVDWDVCILDDAILTGRTAQQVASEVCLLTHKQPTVFAIFKCKNVKIDSAIVEYGEELSYEETINKTNLISNVILQTNLPVDMEFPIIRVPGGSTCDIHHFTSQLRTAVGESNYFEVAHPGVDNNKSFILDEELSNSYSNDFSKIRVFPSVDGFKIVPFAPNVFSESALAQDSLFLNERYGRLYREVLSRTGIKKDGLANRDAYSTDEREKVQTTRSFHTLVVWANYLFSLSTFIRTMLSHEIDMKEDFELDLDDLKLIIGDRLARLLLPQLNQLIKDGEVSPSIKEPLKTPSFLLSPKIKGAYRILKYKIAFKSDSVKMAMDGMFALGRIIRIISKHYMMEVGETDRPLESYESLFESLSVNFDKREHVMGVHQWVDAHVDKGDIIPRYERVKDDNELYCWRRYFAFNSRSLTGQK